MEVIELGIYTKSEKIAIAKNHLIPKQLKRHGMSKKMLRITDAALEEIIDFYTREAGVRTLERKLAELCRKAGKHFLETETQHLTIDATDVKAHLGVRKCLPESIEECDEIGTVNGLAYTELGGDLLKVECAVLEGTGKVELTGSLGDVMKESAMAAISYVRSIAKEYGIPTDFYRTKDIHIHAPEGAVPKDGPSAGVTMTTALVSALTGYPVRSDIAMTGEISLRGRVLAIGGLKEKTMAAYAAGVRTVLIPKDNERDLQNIDPLARDNLTFIPCSRLADVLKEALIRPDAPAKEPVIIPADTKTAHCPKTEPPHAQPTANFAPEHEEKESHTC
jgi:ATP-dependent Lon protease